MASEHLQMSVWSAKESYLYHHQDLSKSSNKDEIISNDPCIVDVRQNNSNDKRNIRLPGCCTSLSPCLCGLLLGILVVSLILAVIITLWLASSDSKLTTAAKTTTTATTSTTTTASTTTSTTTTTTTTSTTTTTTATSTTTTSTTTTSTTTTTATTTTTTTSATTTTSTSTTTSTTETTTTTTTPTTSTTTTATTTTTTTATTSTATTATTTSTTTTATTSPPCTKTPDTTGAIFNFATATIALTYTRYSYPFTASDSSSTVTFILTGDSGPAMHYWLIDDVSVNDTATNTNILVNGNFDLGSFIGWTQFCATNTNCGTGNYGQLTSSPCRSAAYCYMDKCNNGGYYDYLLQSFGTVTGNYYILSFYIRAYANGGPHLAFVMLS
ncbi:unnamed protein product [Rotaria magnacalcarata]|uniref:Uncharacterized protein n=1 Tax=Rotaria magnacalcarata TaxID=392030 RepID=A0A816LJV6_9BILA|nr:unnamed protein product [Rotaria magnacalcarata]